MIGEARGERRRRPTDHRGRAGQRIADVRRRLRRVVQRPHPVERDAMRRNGCRDDAGGLRGRLRPQVVHRVVGSGRKAERGRGRADGLRRATGVEQRHHDRAVRLGLCEDLLVVAVVDAGRVDCVLVDGQHALVLQQGQVGRVQIGQIGAEDERRCAHRPQAHLRLALVDRQPVVRAVADLDRVVVIEAARAAVRLPGRHRVESSGDAGPGGQRIAGPVRAAVALDISAGAPAVGQLLPGRRRTDGQAVGQLQVDRPPAVVQRL